MLRDFVLRKSYREKISARGFWSGESLDLRGLLHRSIRLKRTPPPLYSANGHANRSHIIG